MGIAFAAFVVWVVLRWKTASGNARAELPADDATGEPNLAGGMHKLNAGKPPTELPGGSRSKLERGWQGYEAGGANQC